MAAPTQNGYTNGINGTHQPLPDLAPLYPRFSDIPDAIDIPVRTSEGDEVPPPLPPKPATLPQTIVAHEHDESGAESEDRSTSDVVHVDTEGSELEEVTHHEVQEEIPPPVPSREGRRSSLPQPPRSARPPVPSVPPPVPPPSSRPSLPSTVSHGDFVIVDRADAIEGPPELPPPRTASLS